MSKSADASEVIVPPVGSVNLLAVTTGPEEEAKLIRWAIADGRQRLEPFARALFGSHNGVEALLADADGSIVAGPITVSGSSITFKISNPCSPRFSIWRFILRADLPMLVLPIDGPRDVFAGDFCTIEVPIRAV